MKLKITEARADGLKSCHALQDEIDIIELEYKEKYAEVQDFSVSFEKTKSFGNWVANIHKPKIKEKKAKIEKLMGQYGIFSFNKDGETKYGIRE